MCETMGRSMGVDMVPDYLEHDKLYTSELGESLSLLKLKNNNLLGPTGLYVLPSMNLWVSFPEIITPSLADNIIFQILV